MYFLSGHYIFALTDDQKTIINSNAFMLIQWFNTFIVTISKEAVSHDIGVIPKEGSSGIDEISDSIYLWYGKNESEILR